MQCVIVEDQEQEAGGLLSRLGKKVPLSKIPLLPFVVRV